MFSKLTISYKYLKVNTINIQAKIKIIKTILVYGIVLIINIDNLCENNHKITLVVIEKYPASHKVTLETQDLRQMNKNVQ